MPGVSSDRIVGVEHRGVVMEQAVRLADRWRSWRLGARLRLFASRSTRLSITFEDPIPSLSTPSASAPGIAGPSLSGQGHSNQRLFVFTMCLPLKP